MNNKYTEILRKYFPEASLPYVLKCFTDYTFSLKISRTRKTKMGDYTHPFKDKGHRITVNHDLNKYAFLITFIHELAHLTAYEKYKNRVAPHGKEWKDDFKNLMRPVLNEEVFPADIITEIHSYFINPAASSCTDINLYRALRKYDNLNGFELLENIPEHSIFSLPDGRTFLKGRQLRKRFYCRLLPTNKNYFINPLAKVKLVSESIF